MQQAEFGELAAFAAASGSGVGEDGQAAGFFAAGAEQADEGRVVDGGAAVGQRGERGDAAGAGGFGGGGDGFAVFEAGLAQ